AADPSHVALDVFAFGQRDPGAVEAFGVRQRAGNPYRAEGFDYAAVSVDFSVQLSEQWAFRGNAVGGWIIDEGEHPLPATLPETNVTSASPDLLTLDSQAGLAWTSPNGLWRVAPGLFYHHQKSYFIGGPNLEISRSLFGGDTSLFLNTSFRLALVQGAAWDGFTRGQDFNTTLNALVGWTQTWHPSLLTTFSLQYAWQTGRLHSAWNYVVLSDEKSVPVQIVDERLPSHRHRGQANFRIRWSPAVRWSFGLDLGGYLDTWSLAHLSAQPNLELPVGPVRIRVWYRLSRQWATRYFRDLVRVPPGTPPLLFVTQDSDLGSFWSHGPGWLLSYPMGRAGALSWEARLSGYGFYRDDGLFALGGQLGTTARW
ncbi:MAG: hypothetical protein AAFU79_34245, partial [Myxococcota bacterium]